MDASDVCPTEEAIKAFLEYLVDPILPPRSSLRDTPSLSQQESVAKQVLFFFRFMMHFVLKNRTLTCALC